MSSASCAGIEWSVAVGFAIQWQKSCPSSGHRLAWLPLSLCPTGLASVSCLTVTPRCDRDHDQDDALSMAVGMQSALSQTRFSVDTVSEPQGHDREREREREKRTEEMAKARKKPRCALS